MNTDIMNLVNKFFIFKLLKMSIRNNDSCFHPFFRLEKLTVGIYILFTQIAKYGCASSFTMRYVSPDSNALLKSIVGAGTIIHR